MAQQQGYAYPAAAGQDYQYTAQYAPQQAVSYAPQQAAYAQPQYVAPQQPGYGYGPPQQGGYYNPDEVRTIFMTGFPSDIKDRELANLMRFLPGYEASQLNWKGDFAQGFALFNNGQSAYSAMQAVNNLPFDTRSNLRCEMARKNMYIKADESVKRPRTDAYAQSYGSGAGGGYHGGHSPIPQGPVSYAQVSNTKDNPPCSTLFVGNMGDQVSEPELMQLFSTQPGFVTLKVVRNGKSSTAFVEYADLAAAMHVHDSQQGAVLKSSDRGGLRIQYSKNPFGKKRDHAGNPVDPQTLPALAPRHGYGSGSYNTTPPPGAETNGADIKTEVAPEVAAAAAEPKLEQAPGT